MSSKKMSPKTRIMLLLLFGFMCMEFPGVFFFKDVAEPRILGLPFAYGFMLIGWIYMCAVLFWAYKVNWGEDDKKSSDKEVESK